MEGKNMLKHNAIRLYYLIFICTKGTKFYRHARLSIDKLFPQREPVFIGRIRNMRMNIRKDTLLGGVQVRFDQAMIQRIKHEGFDGLEFQIQSIVPVRDLSLMLVLS